MSIGNLLRTLSRIDLQLLKYMGSILRISDQNYIPSKIISFNQKDFYNQMVICTIKVSTTTAPDVDLVFVAAQFGARNVENIKNLISFCDFRPSSCRHKPDRPAGRSAIKRTLFFQNVFRSTTILLLIERLSIK